MSSKVRRAERAEAEPFRWKQIGRVPEHDAVAAQADSAGANRESIARLEDMRTQFEARLTAVRNQALQEGIQAGERQASERLDDVYSKLAKTVEELAGYRPRLRKQAEQDVIQLALGIARRIVQREVEVDPEVMAALVNAGLQRIERRDVLRVRISNTDAARLRGKLTPRDGGVLEVQEDPSLAPGSVILVTTRGELDCSVETQLAEVQRAFHELMR